MDVEHLRRDAMAILHDSLKRLNLAAHAVDNIKEQVALRATSRAKDWPPCQNFIHILLNNPYPTSAA